MVTSRDNDAGGGWENNHFLNGLIYGFKLFLHDYNPLIMKIKKNGTLSDSGVTATYS